MSERTINSGAGTVVPAAPPTDAGGSRHVLTLAAGSTVLVLLAFVTPLATGVRTAAALHAGPAGLTWMLSAMSVALAVALLTAGRARPTTADGGGSSSPAWCCSARPRPSPGRPVDPGVVIAARLVEGLGGRPCSPAASGRTRPRLPRPGPRGRAPPRSGVPRSARAPGSAGSSPWSWTGPRAAGGSRTPPPRSRRSSSRSSPAGCCRSRPPRHPARWTSPASCCSPPGWARCWPGSSRAGRARPGRRRPCSSPGPRCSLPSWRCRPGGAHR